MFRFFYYLYVLFVIRLLLLNIVSDLFLHERFYVVHHVFRVSLHPLIHSSISPDRPYLHPPPNHSPIPSLSIYSSIQPCLHQITSFIQLSTHPSLPRYVHIYLSFIHPFFHLFLPTFINHPSVYTYINTIIHSFIDLSISPSIHWPIPRSIL